MTNDLLFLFAFCGGPATFGIGSLVAIGAALLFLLVCTISAQKSYTPGSPAWRGDDHWD